jgi:hypothetical protein
VRRDHNILILAEKHYYRVGYNGFFGHNMLWVSPPNNSWVEVIEMGVLEFLLIWAAVIFVAASWVYAYTVPHIPQSIEKVLGLVWISSLLLLAAVSTVIALAHI